MIRKYILILALAPLLSTAADAKCRIVGHTSDGEPLCMTTSDGAGQPYIDDRRNSGSSFNSRRRWEMIQRRQARREGASHTQDMASGGTMHGNILVSPFVPGSQQDRAWQAERKRRGLCGNDRLCLNQ
jgi:hypothetical protein